MATFRRGPWNTFTMANRCGSNHGVQVQLSVAFDLRPNGHATEAQLGVGARLMACRFGLSGKRTRLGTGVQA
jgi:hypothetical protein